jgi:hypothetical protein
MKPSSPTIGKLAAALIMALLALPAVGAQETPPVSAPIAIAPEPVYTFEPVIEGAYVTKAFRVINDGNATLTIDDIKTS